MSFISNVDQKTVKREKEKARELRQSAWWKGQIGQGKCFYCHQTIHPKELTMDHKTPIIRGGKSTKRNLVPACKDCNSEKKYLLLEEWIRQRAEEGNPLPCAGEALD